MSEQPLPIKNDSTPIVDLIVRDLHRYRDIAAPAVIEDLVVRKALGIERYGAALQAHNGRDGHRDAYEEAMDLSVYLRQCVEEAEGGNHHEAYYELYRDSLGLLIRLKRVPKPGSLQPPVFPGSRHVT